MSYAGYIPIVKQFIASLPPEHQPTFLEVGVDRGVTFLSLVAYLARSRETFAAVGIDIVVHEQVPLVLQNLDLTEKQRAFCIRGNSLEVLPQLIRTNARFDVLLLDGDHNYHTVSREMELLERLTYPHSLVVIDDYDGRWAERDLWYSKRDGYEENVLATQPVETEKHGVRAAVDEWLASHPEWQKMKPLQGEPVVLLRGAA